MCTPIHCASSGGAATRCRVHPGGGGAAAAPRATRRSGWMGRPRRAGRSRGLSPSTSGRGSVGNDSVS